MRDRRHRAICPELAGETVPLRDILRERGQRRRDLRATLRSRHETVEALLKLKRGEPEAELMEKPSPQLPRLIRLRA